MNVNRYQAAKNLKPARSLRTPNPNRNALGEYGYPPQVVDEPSHQQQTAAHSNGTNGALRQPRLSGAPARSSSQTRKHEVLRMSAAAGGGSTGGRSTPTGPGGSLTFNASSLNVGPLYEVTVSYVQNGPKQFMVQQRAAEASLKQMMNALGRVPLRTITRKLQLGMPCLARYTQNRTVYRALITGIGRDGACTVSYVDYGYSETVHPKHLYEIPAEFLRHEIFSTRFALAGVGRLEEANADVAGLFSRLVAGKTSLTLKVMPPDGVAFVSYCELYDAAGESILDRLVALCKANVYKFPPPGSLVRGASCQVVIRYIESCAQFFVHTLDNVDAFDRMMDELIVHCRGGNGVPAATVPGVVNVGDALAVGLGQEDFYRVEVIETVPKLRVRLVDYGNTITVERAQLRRLSVNFTHQPPEAYECCLEGFEDATSGELSTPQLEMLSERSDGERKPFKLIVCEVRDGRTIVNLLDESETPVLNVSKKLLKLKHPIKFNKEQQNSQPQKQQLSTKQQQQAPTVANIWSANHHHHHQQQQQQQQQQAAMDKSAESGKVLSSSGVSSSQADYIDLTSEEWIGPPPGNQSSGYENLQEAMTATVGGGLLRNVPRVSGYVGPTNSSRDSSSNTAIGKQQQLPQDKKRLSGGSGIAVLEAANTPVARNDIPRFNRERTQTPYYYEHDDRCDYEENTKEFKRSERNRVAADASSVEQTTNHQQHHAPVTIERPKATQLTDVSSPDDYLPFGNTEALPEQIVPMNTKLAVTPCWWYSPEQFNVRLCTDEDRYQEMMKAMQMHYRNKTNQQQHHQLIQNAPSTDPRVTKLTTGALVVVRHPKNNAYYRGRVLKYGESVQRYKVELVDDGSKLVVSPNDLWMVERRFTRCGPLAIACSLIGVRLLCDVKKFQAGIDAYVSNESPIEALFLEVRDGKHQCKLELQGQDLKTRLMGDGLVAQVFVDVDLTRLKGQTLKVQLIELQGLNNFRVKLYGHEAIFNCRQDGCDAHADSVVAEVRSKYLDRYCVAQVIDVSNDEKLVLSLLVPPLTNQTLPTITQMPVLQGKFNVYITHVESTNCLYVQNVRWGDQITKLMDDLYKYYEWQREHVPLASLAINEMCACRAKDGGWYRAKVVSLQDIDRIEVQLVDYGFLEYAKHSELKQLESHFAECAAFAHKVYLPMGTIGSVEEERVKVEIAQLTEGHELTLKVIDFRNDIWIVDITSNDYSIVSVLKDKQLVVDMDYETIFNQRQAVTPVPGVVVRPSVEDHEGKHQRIRARICHVDNPSQLFIQLESDVPDLHQLQENLQIIASSLPPLRDFSADRYCIAQYSADDLWYRALIIDSHDDLIIQFVDYGHTDIVTSNKKCTLRDINDDLMRWKIYAKQCAMLVQPASSQGTGKHTGVRKKSATWKEIATTILRSLDEVEVQFLAEAQGIHYIGVRSGEKDIAELLVEKKLGVRMLYVPSGGQRCFTSHIESISEFYLQLERDIYPLDTMSNYLSDVSKFPDVQEPRVGMFCIAEYEDDALWYRVKLLNIPRAGEYEVFFIDYGNTSVVKNLKQLEASIAELARLCTKCTLRLPENVSGWSAAAEEKFLELAAMGETVFSVQLHSPGTAVATVELFHEGRNIVDQLVTLCEKGAGANGGSVSSDSMSSSFYMLGDETRLLDESDDKAHVSHVNSPAEFYIQIKNSFDALRNMEELLAATARHCAVIAAGEIHNGLFCLALLASTGKYCRGLVVSEVVCAGDRQATYQVLLVDYGNRATATELRRMTPTIEQISRLAKKCCLEHYLSTDEVTLGAKRWTRIRSRFIELTDGGRELFSFGIVRNDCEPAIVRLFTSFGANVEDLIKDGDESDAEDEPTAVSMVTAANCSGTSEDSTQTRAKPKQAFFRANSDLEFLEN
ncbi:maternal protein tudor [Anopheles bellator]|uniref:maternal protein tudor n=1 Tax=Anopheles bellator TaxID=139047 RepID=UPI0026477A45|nr:maternal protein tudor [Anopheles bellator]